MNGFGKVGRAMAFVVGVAALVGCATPRRSPSEAERASIYRRADLEFGQALLLKPHTRLPEDSPVVRMAPLIFLETSGTNVGTGSGPGPVLYHQQGHTTMNGRRLSQVSYWWWADFRSRSPRDGTRPQGVRITLNEAGEPVIWEILRDESGAVVVFVATSVEMAAAREFGRARPGRLYAVEPEVSSAPDVVVARVIDDGPVPMGPVMHVRAGTGDISVVTCRCSSPQVRELVGDREYELRTVPEKGARSARSNPARAELRLRLPATGWDGSRGGAGTR